MKFKLKWELDGGARYYLGLARGMVLQDIDIIYIHKHYFAFPPKKASKQEAFPPISLSPLGYIKKGGQEEFSSSISHHPKILGKFPAPTQGL